MKSLRITLALVAVVTLALAGFVMAPDATAFFDAGCLASCTADYDKCIFERPIEVCDELFNQCTAGCICSP